jgi:hypothetical protein
MLVSEQTVHCWRLSQEVRSNPSRLLHRLQESPGCSSDSIDAMVRDWGHGPMKSDVPDAVGQDPMLTADGRFGPCRRSALTPDGRDSVSIWPGTDRLGALGDDGRRCLAG